MDFTENEKQMLIKNFEDKLKKSKHFLNYWDSFKICKSNPSIEDKFCFLMGFYAGRLSGMEMEDLKLWH